MIQHIREVLLQTRHLAALAISTANFLSEVLIISLFAVQDTMNEDVAAFNETRRSD